MIAARQYQLEFSWPPKITFRGDEPVDDDAEGDTVHFTITSRTDRRLNAHFQAEVVTYDDYLEMVGAGPVPGHQMFFVDQLDRPQVEQYITTFVAENEHLSPDRLFVRLERVAQTDNEHWNDIRLESAVENPFR